MSREKKYRCPCCENQDLTFTTEMVSIKHYKVREDGNPYKKQFETEKNVFESREAIECPNCGNCCDMSRTKLVSRWLNPNYYGSDKSSAIMTTLRGKVGIR